ncbi:MAG: glutamine-synthetase adenylyltransferase [Pseudomonadota bacterium]
MSFADQMTRLPRPFNLERAADTRAALPWATGELADLLCGSAGCSAYLARLMEQEKAWLQEALDQAPETAIEAELFQLDGKEDIPDLALALRQAKRRIALLVGLSDLGGVWTLAQITANLTALADRAVDLALAAHLRPMLARNKLPGHTLDDLENRAGLFVLAMGKMGAYELNYSSDIDVICLFDDARFSDQDLPDARAVLVKIVRQAMAMLSDITGDGYVFRTDLRLRPDPAVTPVAVSISAAEHYYEALGRTWERAAFIKARACAGDIARGEKFLEDLRPFVWRRHLDFVTIEDAHDIRKKIHDHKLPAGGATLDGLNLKLGPGGIRDIEFYTQTRQLISGGRQADLRVRGTCAALAALAEKGWISSNTSDVLTEDYVTLRTYEHRLQMVADAQTHSLPASGRDWERLAAMMAAESPNTLKTELTELFHRVRDTVEPFFLPSLTDPGAIPSLSEASKKIVARWPSYPALRSQRAQSIFARLKTELLNDFTRATDPEDAIVQFDGFLAGLPAGAQLFALFEANPQLLDLVVDICSSAPVLGRYLSRNSAVLDAVISGSFFAPWPGREALEAELKAELAPPQLDYERKLDAARRWMKEWHFQVGVHHLRGLADGRETARDYTDLAEATVSAIWGVVAQDFARRHGPMPGNGAIVVGMGSLGAARLSATSDLDLIVIYDATPDEVSSGRRSLAATVYYARLTQALVTALSAQTAEGALYEVDMRLRPSGRQGPVAAGWQAFQDYQTTQAWTWEHLALTRARPIAGAKALAEAFETFRRNVLSHAPERAVLLRDLQDMRERLQEAKPKRGVWDIARGPGGLQDIELFAQAGALISGCPITDGIDQLTCEHTLCDVEDREVLLRVYLLEAAVKQASRLVAEGAIDRDRLGPGAQKFLLRETSTDTMDDLGARLISEAEAAASVIGRGLALLPEDGPPVEKESR